MRNILPSSSFFYKYKREGLLWIDANKNKGLRVPAKGKKLSFGFFQKKKQKERTNT